MKKNRFLLISVLCLVSMSICAQKVEKGVSKELASQRKANISNVRYDLTFNIPAGQKDKVTGRAIVSFNLKNKEDVVLDFEGKINGDVFVGKKKRKVTTKNGHITVPAKFIKPGLVLLTFQFTSQNDALERHNDYLFTRFDSNDASSVFPCFNQPDIKAKYNTQLSGPEGWKAIINDGDKPISTRQYAFFAGKFQENTAIREGYQLRILHRETDSAKLLQLEKVFDVAAQSLKWMENYTNIKCPFKEYGLVVLPDFEPGGMEYQGFILLSDQYVFPNDTPTKEEEQSRMEFLAHEISHFWFGTMVALKDTEETWAKEVLANFMASKICRRQYSKADYDLNFIRTFQSRAIAIDRTEGTHPIAMPMENNYHTSIYNDQIFCNKVPVMMDMLEEIMGASNLQNGLRNFLHDNFEKEVTWNDLLTALDKEAPAAGVRQFAEVWVQQKGMPIIHTSYKNGQLVVSQTDPFGRGLCWRQKFQIYVIYDLGGSRTINVDMNEPTMTFKLKGKPNYIIPNYDGKGYGRFTLDDEYTKLLPLRLITTRNDLNRYLLLQTIHDNYLMGKVNPSHFGEIYRMLMKEKNPLVMSTAIDHMFKIAFDMTPEQRNTLELCMMDLLGENKNKEFRQALIRKLSLNMVSPDVMKQIETIWKNHNETIFDEHDYMNMAYRLAMLQPNRWEDIIKTERDRLQTEDLKKEFDYVSRACNPDEKKRNDLFNNLLKHQNRQQKSWALQALNLLSADIYEPGNIKYLPASFNALQNIQQTSDTYFPANWLQNLMAHHKGVVAKQEVTKFIAANPDFPDNLRSKILEASWILMKQEPYIEKEKPATKKATTKKKK